MNVMKTMVMVLVVTFPAAGWGETYLSPLYDGEKTLAVFVGKSKTKYNISLVDLLGFPFSVSGNTDRTVLGGAAELPLTASYGAFGFGAYELDVDNGTGFNVGGGFKGTLNNVVTLPVNMGWYARFGYWNEEPGSETIDPGPPAYIWSYKDTGYELSLGVVANFRASGNVKPWVGLEFTPLSDFTIDGTRSDGASDSADYERKDNLGLRGGIEFGNLYLTVGMMNETSFIAGYKMGFGGPRAPMHRSSPPRRAAPAVSSRHPVDAKQPAPVSVQPAPVIESRPSSAGSAGLSITAQAQQVLQQLGYNPGPADGVYGAKTRSAVEAYQRDNGLPVTGRLDAATREMMGL